MYRLVETFDRLDRLGRLGRLDRLDSFDRLDRLDRAASYRLNGGVAPITLDRFDGNF